MPRVRHTLIATERFASHFLLQSVVTDVQSHITQIKTRALNFTHKFMIKVHNKETHYRYKFRIKLLRSKLKNSIKGDKYITEVKDDIFYNQTFKTN